MARRSAQAVIDDAIDDNRWWEYLCFSLIVVFVLVGLAGFVVGLYLASAWIAVPGAALAFVAWPALGYANQIRRDNIRIRMCEVALEKAKTAEEASAILREHFGRAGTKRGESP